MSQDIAAQFRVGEPKLTDAEFAVEMWHHEGPLNLIGSGAIHAVADAIRREFMDLPDDWYLEKVLQVIMFHSRQLNKVAEQKMGDLDG